MSDACFLKFVKSLGVQKTLVGETFSTDARATTDFTYSTGASSSLGVGVSTVENSGFTGSGTETTSATGTDSFAAVHGSAYDYYDSDYAHDLDHANCQVGRGNVTQYYETVNAGWTTGAAEEKVASAPYDAEVCVDEPTQGIKVYVNRSSAIEWSDGFVIEGIGLSAQTGYTTQAEVEETWPSSSSTTYHNRNCGVHNFPPLPGTLIAVARGV